MRNEIKKLTNLEMKNIIFKSEDGIINITPHDLEIRINEETYTIPASGIVARASEVVEIKYILETKVKGKIIEVPVIEKEFSNLYNIPEATKGKIFVASRQVISGLKDRPDILGVGTTVRDKKTGMISHCLNLSI